MTLMKKLALKISTQLHNGNILEYGLYADLVCIVLGIWLGPFLSLLLTMI